MEPLPRLASGLSGRDHYEHLYREKLAWETEWLRRGARLKADAITQLLARAGLTPDSILEIGAGTGAVIGALQTRGIGKRHYAVDFSPEAVDVIRKSSSGIAAAVADVTRTPDPFGAGPYDLAFASHVVEHLEEPARFLRALQGIPLRYLIVEVPLENLFFGRIKARFADRSRHPAGHVQFFDRSTFLTLLETTGWQVRDVFVYAPVHDAETFTFAYGSAPLSRRFIKRCTESLLPRVFGPAWTRYYHAHCAALCVKRSP